MGGKEMKGTKADDQIPDGFVGVNCTSLQLSSSKLALYCEFDGKNEWIPVSKIHDNSEVWEPGQTGELVIPEWLAIEKGLV